MTKINIRTIHIYEASQTADDTRFYGSTCGNLPGERSRALVTFVLLIPGVQLHVAVSAALVAEETLAITTLERQ